MHSQTKPSVYSMRYRRVESNLMYSVGILSLLHLDKITNQIKLLMYSVRCQALSVFREMQRSRVKPNVMSWTVVIAAFAQNGKPDQAHIFSVRCRGVVSNLMTALIAAYTNNAQPDQALSVFHDMQKSGIQPDVASWNSLIASFGQNGKAALKLLEDMQRCGVKPNEITFNSVFNACNHAGLVNEVIELYNTLQTRHGITPDLIHGNCIVDALGRAGRLEEAEQFANNMKKTNIVTWTSLLGACRIHGDVQRAERVAKQALERDLHNASVYVMLANTYAAKGMFEKEAHVRNLMQERGIKKIPGQSWIEIHGSTHFFIANDRTHPQFEAINAKRQQLFQKMKEVGYRPDTSWVLRQLEDEMAKELALCEHSEKTALCYGLISTPPKTPLLIKKNLRICGDCHTAIKFISKLEERTITVRDASRYHVFKDGTCSCMDYY